MLYYHDLEDRIYVVLSSGPIYIYEYMEIALLQDQSPDFYDMVYIGSLT